MTRIPVIAEAPAPGLRHFRGRVAMVYVGMRERLDGDVPILNPPMGVQVLATLLRREGAEAEIFDNRYGSPDELVAAVAAYRPDLVGFSFLSTSVDQAVALARDVRARGLRTLAGGVHATVRPEELAATGAFDVVVKGDGERALLEICDRIATGAPIDPIVAGEPWGDLDRLPVIDAFDVYRPVYGAAGEYRSVSLQMGRGCPMNCQFCELARDAGTYALPNRYQARRPATVVDEARTYLDRWDANYVVVLDSIATQEPESLTALLDFAAERGGTCVQFNAHVNRFTAEIAAHLEALGDQASVWFGFESGSDAMLRRLDKAHTAERAREKARLCLDAGARLGVNVLLGVPGETAEDRVLTRAFLAELMEHRNAHLVMPNPNIFNPLPGTPLFKHCTDNDLIADATDYRIWSDTAIEEAGRGPVRTVDYDEVIADYRAMYALVPTGPPRHKPWADGPAAG